MTDPIDERIVQLREVLEACAAEGFDPAEVTLISYRSGKVEVFPSAQTPMDGALAVLHRLTAQAPTRSDTASASSYVAGGFRVYAERHPDAPVVDGSGETP